MSESTERPTIQLSRDLEARIDRRRREAGFDSIDAYVQFILEQVLRATESEESPPAGAASPGPEEVRRTLRDLGYL